MDWASILSISIWSVAKVVVLLSLLIYLIFATVVVRQVHMMTKVISDKWNTLIKLIAWLLLGLAIFVILLSLIIL